MVADVSGISYFAPILAFLIVFVIVFALLNKTKLLGVNGWVQLFVSFLIATIFVSAAGVRDYVLKITPWFGALIISLFFLLLLMWFIGLGDNKFVKGGIGIAVVVLLLIIFLVSGFVVFSESIVPYLPGSSGEGADPNLLLATGWIFSSRVSGAVLLLIIAAIVSWVLVKSSVTK